MKWDRSQTIALAKTACTHCHGYGMRPGRNEQEIPCNCVFRAIFRACYARFRDLVLQEKHLSRVKLEFYSHGKDSYTAYGRKTEEYLADFGLISRRSLSAFEYDLFRFHFLLGADWKLCCARLRIDRGTFFHSVYRIEQKLGRVFRQLEPYGLFPLDEYFGGVVTTQLHAKVEALPGVIRMPLPHAVRPPLQPAA